MSNDEKRVDDLLTKGKKIDEKISKCIVRDPEYSTCYDEARYDVRELQKEVKLLRDEMTKDLEVRLKAIKTSPTLSPKLKRSLAQKAELDWTILGSQLAGLRDTLKKQDESLRRKIIKRMA